MSAEVPEVMPVNWDSPPDGLRVSLCQVDDFGFPVERRGLTTKLPNDPHEFEAFANTVAATVRATVMHVLERRGGAGA